MKGGASAQSSLAHSCSSGKRAFLGRLATRRPVLPLRPFHFPSHAPFHHRPSLSPSFSLGGVAEAQLSSPPFRHLSATRLRILIRLFFSTFFFLSFCASLLHCWTGPTSRCALSDAGCHNPVRAAPSCHLRQDGGQEETRVQRGRRGRAPQQAAGRQRQQQVQGRFGRHERRGLD